VDWLGLTSTTVIPGPSNGATQSSINLLNGKHIPDLAIYS
jgi:hypothetical protein